jgi:hypothetical protein
VFEESGLRAVDTFRDDLASARFGAMTIDLEI